MKLKKVLHIVEILIKCHKKGYKILEFPLWKERKKVKVDLDSKKGIRIFEIMFNCNNN